jgi:tetratricopeptide (TPR) repeat protein
VAIGTLRHSLLLVALATAPAFADEPVEPPADPPAEAPVESAPPELDPATVARLRELYDKKDYVAARQELLAAHAKTKHPQLLFALGQVELNLQHYPDAIAYYEQFLATNPPQEQIDLAQQAIGAARIQLANQKPRRHRHWHLTDTLIVVGGGLALGGGAGLFAYGRHKSLDDNGTLTDYERRVDRARTMQVTGIAVGAVGVLAITTALVRWRLRPEDGYEVTVSTRHGTTASVGWRW